MFSAYPPGIPNLQRRLAIVTALFVALLLAAAGLTLAIGDGEIVTRIHFSSWVQRHYAQLRVVTDYGLYVFYVLFLAVLAYGALRREAGLRLLVYAYLLAQLLGAALTVRAFKMLLGRARPDVTPLPGFESEWIGFTWEAGHHSFPSGHTADIVTSAVFATLLFRSPFAVALAVAWAVALGFTRLALAKHYPTDAIAGAAIALVTCVLVAHYWLQPRLARVGGVAAPRWWSMPPGGR
jgi:membrane-associated phospholipid phosphatase